MTSPFSGTVKLSYSLEYFHSWFLTKPEGLYIGDAEQTLLYLNNKANATQMPGGHDHDS